jgi:hypothetical protein
MSCRAIPSARKRTVVNQLGMSNRVDKAEDPVQVISPTNKTYKSKNIVKKKTLMINVNTVVRHMK